MHFSCIFPLPALLRPDLGGEVTADFVGRGIACGGKGVRCGAGRSGFSIDWQGGMRPCNTFPCGSESMRALGFKEAWRRTNQTALSYLRPAECEGCYYEPVCKHCVAEHAAGAQAGHASPTVCAWGRKMVVEGLLTIQPAEA